MERMLEPEMAKMMLGYLEKIPAKGRMVEIGTGWGESTLFFALAKPKYKIYTIDAFGMVGDGRVWDKLHADNIYKAVNYYKEANNVIQILGDSQSVPWELPVNCIYLDGDHRYDGVKKDFEIYSPYLKDGGIIFFDDYLQPGNPTNGVKKLVDEICLNGWELLFEGITAAVKRRDL